MCTRISAIDWVEGGTTIEDALQIARMLHAAGTDILAVSMAVGGIVSHGDANTIIGAGRADMVALARGYLEDAYFARHAARAQNYTGMKWPNQYRRAADIRLRGE
jgi:anthraniloyl-CoA monooxygenase